MPQSRMNNILSGNLLLLLLLSIACTPSQTHKKRYTPPAFTQLITDSLFNSSQIISIFSIPKKALPHYQIEIKSSGGPLTATSELGAASHAIAAINGSYFNMKTGASVTYSEWKDSVISMSPIRTDRAFLANGAVVINKTGTLVIEASKSDQYYAESTQEKGVLVSGPLLLLNSTATELATDAFVTKRHPRTCLCIQEESLLFITVDGRQEKAMGMNLIELQQFLQDQECIDAINLDGGGSTSLWMHEKGIVNFPSDKSGERPVSNAILILGKK